MVRIAGFKGLNLITLRLSYNSTAISVQYAFQSLSNVIRDGNLSFSTKSRCP